MKVKQVNERKAVVEFTYLDLVERGLERFLRSGTLYGKGIATVITEEPFWFAAAEEYLAKNNKYIKHAGFPVVVMRDDGPTVLIPLFTAGRLYDRRNVWAAEEERVPLTQEDKITQFKNSLMTQFYEIESLKTLLETTLKGLEKAAKGLKTEVLEEIAKKEEKEPEMLPISQNLELSQDLIRKALQEVVTVSKKYDHILLKVFKRTTPAKKIETINWEKAFNILADNWKLTDKVRKQFVEQAKEIKETVEKITPVVQTKMVEEKPTTPPERKSMKMTAVFAQIWDGITGWLGNLISTGKELLGSLTGLSNALDDVDALIE